MVLKAIKKIHRLVFRWINKIKFTKIKCNMEQLIIGPEVYTNFAFKHPENITIGKGTVLNGDCFINAMGTLNIGKYCHIGRGLTIYTHNHNFKSTDHIPYDSDLLLRAVTIGDAVWIGANVTIAPGTIIGHGVVISIGSVVFGEIPDGAIIRGNPAKIINYRDMDSFWKCYNNRKFV